MESLGSCKLLGFGIIDFRICPSIPFLCIGVNKSIPIDARDYMTLGINSKFNFGGTGTSIET